METSQKLAGAIKRFVPASKKPGLALGSLSQSLGGLGQPLGSLVGGRGMDGLMDGLMDGWMDRFPLYSTELRLSEFPPGPTEASLDQNVHGNSPL